MTRRLARISVRLAGGLVLLAAALVIGLQVFAGTDTAGRMIRQRINALIPGRVSWEAQSVFFFSGQVRLRGFSVAEPGGRKVITADSLSADIRLADLLFGRITVESAHIGEPGVFLSLDPRGRLNLADALIPPETGGGQPADLGNWQIPRVLIQRLKLDDGTFTFQAAGPEIGQSRTRINLKDIAIRVANANLRKQSGKARLSIAAGRISTAGIRIPIRKLELTAELNRGRVEPIALDVHSNGSHLKISGGVENVFASPRMRDIRVSLTANLSEIRRMLGLETQIAGRLKLQAAAEGAPANPDVSMDLEYNGGRLWGLEIPAAHLAARMHDRQVEINRLDAALAGGRIESTGSTDLRRAFADGFAAAPADLQAIAYQLEIRTSGIRLSELPGTGGVNGRISGPVSLEGRGISPGAVDMRVNAQLRADSLVPAAFVSRLDLQTGIRAELAGKKLVLEQAEAVSGDFEIHTAGTWDIAANRLDLAVSAAVPEIENLAGRLGVSAITGGAAELTARVSGPADLPDVTADLAVSHPRFAKTALERITADISFADGRLSVTPLKITAQNSMLLISGGIRLLEPQSGKPLADPAVNAEIRQGSLFLQDFLPTLSGRVQISGSISGTAGSLEGRLRANGRDIETGVVPIPAASLSARIHGRQIYLDLLEITAAQDLSLSARGRVVLNPEIFGGRISIADLRVSRGGRELAAAHDVSASLENGNIVIAGTRIMLPEDGFVTIRGSGDLNRQMDITAEGMLPAGLARGLVPYVISPEGRVLVSARVRGSLGSPDLSAEIRLSDLGCTFPQTGQHVHAVNGKIRLENQQVTIKDLSGRLGEGTFTLAGRIGLADYRPVRLGVEIGADNLTVRVPDTLEARVGADLKLFGTAEKATLAGNIEILDGLYYRDVNLSLIQMAGEIGQRRRKLPQVPETFGLDVPFFKELALDVSIGHRRPFEVDNNLALLYIRPQLRVGGTAANPRVTGRAEITEGTITYRRTEFTVEKGVIDFVNPYRIEPAVDIRAESRVRQWTIILRVTGTPDNLDFQLFSSPPVSDADILSLLAVGKTTRELGESGIAASPEAMLANLLAGRLEKQVKSGTGLDIVEMQYQRNGTGAQETDDVRVMVGKQLSRRLTVKYGVASKGGEMVRQSTGTYQLMQDLSLRAFQDSTGALGGEMRYRLEFR